MKKAKLFIIVGIIIFIGIISFIGISIYKEKNKEIIVLTDNLKFEINSGVKLLSLIKETKNIEILSEDELIDTKELGKKELFIKYKNQKKEEKVLIVNIEIIDTTNPVIESNEVFNVKVGSKINILKDVKVYDNSNETITPTIEGEYNLNKVGEYKLKVVASDSSENKVSKDIVLKVNDIKIYTSGYYVNKSEKDVWYAYYLDKKGNISKLFNFCPNQGCGGYRWDGKYKKDGNKITYKIKSTMNETETTIIKDSKEYEMIIIDENTLSEGNLKYKHVKNIW